MSFDNYSGSFEHAMSNLYLGRRQGREQGIAEGMETGYKAGWNEMAGQANARLEALQRNGNEMYQVAKQSLQELTSSPC